jgi:hypothetical protein
LPIDPTSFYLSEGSAEGVELPFWDALAAALRAHAMTNFALHVCPGFFWFGSILLFYFSPVMSATVDIPHNILLNSPSQLGSGLTQPSHQYRPGLAVAQQTADNTLFSMSAKSWVAT